MYAVNPVTTFVFSTIRSIQVNPRSYKLEVITYCLNTSHVWLLSVRLQSLPVETYGTVQRKRIDHELRELPWLAEVDATALQSSLRNLDNAFQNFFRRVKNKERPYGYPKFKSKHVHRKSYVSKNNHGTIALSDKKIRLPKLGMVKCRISKEVQGRILSATVSQNPSGKYFVSLCCTEVEIEKLPAAGKVTGVDLGVKALATTAEGDIYPNNKYLNQSDKKLRRFARRLSRKKKGSRNYEKARIRKARLEEHIANQRQSNDRSDPEV